MLKTIFTTSKFQHISHIAIFRIAFHVACVIIFCSSNITYGAEFYEVEAPYRKSLDKNYAYSIDADEGQNERQLDKTNVRRNFVMNANRIYAEEQETQIKLIADNDEKEYVNRTKFYATQTEKTEGENATESQIEKKEEKPKSWLEDWLPNTNIKPMEILGAYTTFKFFLFMPMSTGISATETRNNFGDATKTNLFTGQVDFTTLPAFAVAIGNDKFKIIRWEFELGYFPLIGSTGGSLSSSQEMSNYTFFLSKKETSVHLLSLGLNIFLQHDFGQKNVVAFFGGGLGVGYAFSMSSTLSSNFVMPIASLNFGVSFMVGKKSKANLSYKFMYSTFSLPNKYSFDRQNSFGTNVNDRAILGGALKFDNLFINAISLEYQFYTA